MPAPPRLPFPADNTITGESLGDLLDAHIEAAETGDWTRWRAETERLSRAVSTNELLRRCRDMIRRPTPTPEDPR